MYWKEGWGLLGFGNVLFLNLGTPTLSFECVFPIPILSLESQKGFSAFIK